MSFASHLTRSLVALLVLASVAHAQAPTVDPSGRPSPSPAAAGPTGAAPAASGGGGGYYYDDGEPMYEEPEVIRFGPTPELHVVRTGDTLWDISTAYFADAWQWPKVWSYNPQITNPHWIYPGDLVRLMPRGTFVTDPSDPLPDAGPGPAQVDPVPAPQKRLAASLRQIAFVDRDELDTSIRISGAVDDKELLATGDEVYLAYPKGKPPQVGKRYSVYREEEKVDAVGSYVRLLGQLEVVSVKKDKQARAVITDTRAEIERGALVGPLLREFKNVAPVPASVDLQGAIIAMLTKDQLIGTGEVVFVNLGEKSGLKVGNRMFVIRRGDGFEPVMGADQTGKNDNRYPARALGEVVIVEVGKKMSIGLITLATQEMGVGDLVLMQKAR
ncbi:MAG: LysM peptidoglycan-binding domain-containing protein [Kofleriaceae bacterium]|jgi:hypothetical protein|nr:LysM peptidoglycan-binding domain-containing protein [Kofleriaceae bacterium]MBP6836124.1 LysM peptidoglycan-binding domain-containing protein [Kofleriaceae bacterium]MBP9206745.1 LysM peptidoglycan-binding domain-containing protein [Kofleriaceae bacterium]